jgi:hypothetical protein
MGDPSDLRLVPESSASIPIDWTRIPEATKKYFLQSWGYDWENDVQRSLPATIGELAKMFDEGKFFGYMCPKLCTLLMDISEFGLEAQQASGVFPRFYMKYLEAIWFILFLPGKRDGISGYSPNIDADEVSDNEEVSDDEEVSDAEEISDDKEVSDDEDVSDDEEVSEEQRMYYKKQQRMITKDTKVAQQFDLKLTEQIPRGATRIVSITKRLCGWDAWMLESSLEEAQLMEAIETLPQSHPAYKTMIRSMFSSLRRR